MVGLLGMVGHTVGLVYAFSKGEREQLENALERGACGGGRGLKHECNGSIGRGR